METRLIHKTSQKIQQKIEWIKLGETEWQYCGAVDEVKWDVITEAIGNFFDGNRLLVAITRNDSFEIGKENLLSSLQQHVGSSNFFIWSEDFLKVIEFNKIGVFRRGVFNAKTSHLNLRTSYNKISPGSSDKVKGKFVKYVKGDCLSLNCSNGKYLAVFIAEKFNKYYDFTLIEFYKERRPVSDDFINGRFFGCYGESTENVYPATERLMLPCLEVDANPLIEKVCSIKLIEPLEKASYAYNKYISEILQHYHENMPQRKRNTENFDKLPNILFISNRLIKIKEVLQVTVPLVIPPHII